MCKLDMMIVWVLVMILSFKGHDALMGNIATPDEQATVRKTPVSHRSLDTKAVPDVCEGPQNIDGLTYDKYCSVADGNLLVTLPPGMVTDARQCESLSINSVPSNWYNYRASGACEILSFCRNMVEEVGSVTGTDPGEGKSCFIDHQEVLLVIGGHDQSSVFSGIDVITEDPWVITGALPDAPQADYGMAAAFIDDQVVVCGGNQNAGNCEHLDLTSNTWQQNSQLTEARSYAASVVYDKTIYVFGGLGSEAALSTVEKYDALSNTWDLVPEWSMPEATFDYCAVVKDHHIYIIGGYDIQDIRAMRRLFTVTGNYEIMPSMQHGRYGHSCALTIIEGEEGIMVTGGAPPYLSSTEFYSFRMHQWRFLADMNAVRGYHGLHVLNGVPIVFGGRDATSYLDSIEVYSKEEDKWTTIGGALLSEPKRLFAYVKVPWIKLWPGTTPYAPGQQ